MIRVAIFGATGYTGIELLRILVQHPLAEITVVTSETYKDTNISTLFPSFKGVVDFKLVDADTAIDTIADVDVAFTCLPHGKSMEVVSKILDRGKRVIDLSGDFRFKKVEIYEKWYRIKHSYSSCLEKAVYGLPEIFREEIKDAILVANPGCYATSVIVPLYPLIRKGIVRGTVVADCKSGITGAGRKAELRLIYPESAENFYAYSVDGHRHNPEMEEVLSTATGEEVKILFIPHLVPMSRGILSTIYVDLDDEYSWDDIKDVYEEFYRHEFFVKLYPQGSFPQTRDVRGTNFISIGWEIRKDKGKLLVISAIDNLVKGASGQAVQNMNIMFGIDEPTALMNLPFFM